MQRDVLIRDCADYKLTNHRALCRRGVVWLGQTCNLRCYFCYFADRIESKNHPEHAFMALGKAKDLCRTLVEVYGNSSVDIQGGEPTIYPDICELLRYCNEIGLKPTLITNAVALSSRDICRRIKDAGVFDLLISLHGIGEVYDTIVGVKGASRKQIEGIENCREIGIPFRVNITLTMEALSQIEALVAIAIERGARAVNFIAFNPFVDQSDDQKRAKEAIPAYSDTAQRLMPLIDQLSGHDIEVNVRYLPFCVFPAPYRKYLQNFQQIVYDLHEWETAGETWSGAAAQRRSRECLSAPLDFFQLVLRKRAEYQKNCPGQVEPPNGAKQRLLSLKKGIAEKLDKDYPALYRIAYRANAYWQRITSPVASAGGGFPKEFYLPELGEVPGFSELEYAYKEYRVLMTKTIHPYRKGTACAACDLTAICDGFHADYGALIGFAEAVPVDLGGPIYDPRHYMNDQMKVVEEQEYDWALPVLDHNAAWDKGN